MGCERVQDLLSEFLDGSLPESERAVVNVHLPECGRCKAVKEELEETLLLLRNLPSGEAPPELLERIRRRIAQEEAAAAPLWKKLFLPAHVKIPLEAAAAILLFLLVYGARKEEPPKLFAPRPAARMDAASAAPAEPAEKKAREAPSASRGEAASEAVPRVRPAKPEGAEPARTPSSPPAAPLAQSPLPVVPAQRVSTAGERIEPSAAPEENVKESASPRLFAAPPSRLLRPVPFGREVTIEVAPENRPGLEDRIAATATRLGGSVRGGPERSGDAVENPADAVRVHLPANSAKPFLDELSKLGTLPPEGMPGWTDLPAGPTPEVVVYTVRIRVR